MDDRKEMDGTCEDAESRNIVDTPGEDGLPEPPEWLPTDNIVRDYRGRFLKGASTPNPSGRGAGRKPRRMFGMTQTAKDLLELLEQPVTVSKGKRKQEVPAIVAIYERLIHMAVQGDWNAIKKCVELREKYSDFREQTLGNLLESAVGIRERYREAGREMPDDVRELVEHIERRVAEGQFRAA